MPDEKGRKTLAEAIGALRQAGYDETGIREVVLDHPRLGPELEMALEAKPDVMTAEIEEFNPGDPVQAGQRVFGKTMDALNPLASPVALGEKAKAYFEATPEERMKMKKEMDPETMLQVLDTVATLIPVFRGGKAVAGSLGTLGPKEALKQGAEVTARQGVADTLTSGVAGGGAAITAEATEGDFAPPIAGIAAALATGKKISDMATPQASGRKIEGPQDVEITKAAKTGKAGDITEELAFQKTASGGEEANKFFARQSEQAGEATGKTLEKSFGDPRLGAEVKEGSFDAERIVGNLRERLKDFRDTAGVAVRTSRDEVFDTVPKMPKLKVTMRQAVDETLKEFGVTFKGGKPQNVGRINVEGVQKPALDLVLEVREVAKGVNNYKKAVGLLSSFDSAIDDMVAAGAIADKSAPILKQTRQALKSKMNEALDGVPGDVKKKVLEAEEAFSEIAGPTERLSSVVSKKVGQKYVQKDAREFAKDFFRHKSQAVLADDLVAIGLKDKTILDDARSAFVQEMFNQATTGQTTKINPDVLDRLWNSTKKGAFSVGVKERIFDPSQIKAMDDLVEMFKKTGPRSMSELAVSGKGGSQTQGALAITRAFTNAFDFVGRFNEAVFTRGKAKKIFKGVDVAPPVGAIEATTVGAGRGIAEGVQSQEDQALRRALSPSIEMTR